MTYTMYHHRVQLSPNKLRVLAYQNQVTQSSRQAEHRQSLCLGAKGR